MNRPNRLQLKTQLATQYSGTACAASGPHVWPWFFLLLPLLPLLPLLQLC